MQSQIFYAAIILLIFSACTNEYKVNDLSLGRAAGNCDYITITVGTTIRVDLYENDSLFKAITSFLKNNNNYIGVYNKTERGNGMCKMYLYNHSNLLFDLTLVKLKMGTKVYVGNFPLGQQKLLYKDSLYTFVEAAVNLKNKPQAHLSPPPLFTTFGANP